MGQMTHVCNLPLEVLTENRRGKFWNHILEKINIAAFNTEKTSTITMPAKY